MTTEKQDGAEPSRPAERLVRCDAVVVGGGPAGLHAGLELATAGVDVVLVDESSELGGQYYKRRLGAVRQAYGDFRPAGTDLIDAVRRSGAGIFTSRVVWGVDDDHKTLLTTHVDDADSVAIRADMIIVATGAYERSVPFPGWQLPGVVTPGYALHLATCDVEPVGRRALIAGSGPFLLSVACALLDVGVEVVGVVEANHPYRLSRHAISAVTNHPERLWEFGRYLAKLAAHRVPIWQGVHIDSAIGDGRLESVCLVPCSGARTRQRRQRTARVDTLAVGYGFRPSTELLRLLGAPSRVDDRTGDVVPIVDSWGRTLAAGVYAAGEAIGIAGVHAAVARGRLAAAAALADWRDVPPKVGSRTLRRARRQQRFADLQTAMFPPPWSLAASVPDQTQVCRCEGVSAAEIRTAAMTGWNDRNGVKGFTRAGMGPCQGRQCGFAVSAIVAACGNGHSGDPFPSRMPIKPLRIGGGLLPDAVDRRMD